VKHLFSIAERDELWFGGVLIESRASHGQARCRGAGIDATDVADPQLVERAQARMTAMRALAREMSDARVRLVASARRVNGYEREEATMSVTIGGISIVTTPELFSRPAVPLRPCSRQAPAGEGLPILWHNGSAAVLLHEAAGHAAEHGQHSSQWPGWLTITDEPDFAIDDTGIAARAADLMTHAPACFRRASFRDVPIPRMTRLIARQQDAPWSLPGHRIDVHFVAGGAYEPLTEMVTLSISAADLVHGDEITPLAPFQLRVARERVAQAIIGASGEPLRYPGVVCSREGQEVVVGSFAPLMITTELM
jgi:hypothetical protein